MNKFSILLLLFGLVAFPSKGKIKAGKEWLYPISIGDSMGYIDSSGSILVKAKFAKAYPFRNGFGLVLFQNNDVGLIDAKGNLVFHTGDPDPVGKSWYKLLDDGAPLINVGLPNGLHTVIFPDSGISSSMRYESIGSFHEGLAKVSIDSGWVSSDTAYYNRSATDGSGRIEIYGLRKTLVGFADKSGELVIPALYQSVSDFYHGYAVGRIRFEDTVLLVMNHQGIIVNPAMITDDSFRCFAYMWIHHKLQEMDCDGNILPGDRLNGFIEYQDRHRDSMGNLVFPPVHDYAFSFSEGVADRYTYPTVDGQQGPFGFQYFSLAGKPISNLMFSNRVAFSEGVSGVCFNNKFGFLNKEGIWLIAPRFEGKGLGWIYDEYVFRGGIAKVYEDESVCYINKAGRVIWRGEKGKKW